MRVKIFGERHTGTNAMWHMMAQNFGIICENHGPWGWKHRMAPRARERSKFELDEWLFIFMFRNPYTWMEAMYRQPYNYHDPTAHNRQAFSQYIRQPFEHHENLAMCWQEKNNSYALMANNVPNAVFVKMEDLARSPDMVRAEIGTFGGLKPTDKKAKIQGYYTGMGQQHGKRASDISLQTEMEPEDIKFANQYLSADLVRYLGYRTITGEEHEEGKRQAV